MKRILILFLFIEISIYGQWFTQTSGTQRHLLNLDILDVNTGYICGDMVGAILKTTNSGLNWILQPEPLSDQYNSISFSDNNTGIAVGPPGIVLRTTNSGLNWLVISRPGGDLGEVQFVNQNWAYACGGGVIRSIDGGITWTLLGNFPSVLQSLFFTDTLTGTVVGTNGFIITTTNGGANWTQRLMMLPVQLADSSLYCIQYINSATGYAGGNNGIVVKTTNGGINWQYIHSGTLFPPYGIYFLNENSGHFVSTAGRIFRTTNGGVNWIQQTSGVIDPLRDIEFINSNTGWIAGFNGRILKTTNGGLTWIQPISSEIPLEYQLEQNYPNPFNPVTKIRFAIPVNVKSKTSNVKLVVFDVLGREVTTLVNEQLQPGTYEVEWDGSNYPSGVYYYKLSASDYTETKKMVVLK